MKNSKLLDIAKVLQEVDFPPESCVYPHANEAYVFEGQTLGEACSFARRLMIEIDRWMLSHKATERWGRFIGFKSIYPSLKYRIYRVAKDGSLEQFLVIIPPAEYAAKAQELPW